MELLDRKNKKQYLIVLVVIIIIFLVGMSVYLVKDLTDGTCGAKQNNIIPSIDNVLTGDTVTNDSVFYQEMFFDSKELPYYEYYDFCLKANVNGNKPLKIGIYELKNTQSTFLGAKYFFNNSGRQCINIGNQTFKLDSNYVGFRCFNCNNNGNNLTLYESTGTKRPLIVDNVTNYDNVLSFNMVGVMNCQYTIFRLFKYMILTIFLFSLIFLINIGIKYAKRVAFDGWN